MTYLGKERHTDRVNIKDEIRKNLTALEQAKLQLDATNTIGEDCAEHGYVHLIDCHLTTRTGDGFLFGLTPEHLNNYRPDVIIYLSPPLKHILENREKDSTRKRDVESLEQLQRHEQVNLRLLKTISEITNIPLVVTNEGNGKISEFIGLLQDTIEKYKPVKLYSIGKTNIGGKKTAGVLTDDAFIPSIPRGVQEVVDAATKVSSLATSWSKQTRKPVYLVNNISGGAVFQYSVPHWASQFDSRHDAIEFTKRVNDNRNWKNFIQLCKSPFAIRLFLNENTSSELDGGNSYIMNYVDEFKKSLYDMAILETARDFMHAGKLDSFVYSIADTLVPQNGDFVYVGQNKTRISEVANVPGISVLVTDTYKGRDSLAFLRYNKELVNQKTPEIGQGYFDLNTLDWQDIHDESDLPPLTQWHETEKRARLQEGNAVSIGWKEKPYFMPSDAKPRPQTSQLDNLGIVYFDPYMGSDRSAVWWANVPEVVYAATDVMCSTNLGRIHFKDFLRVKVGQMSGLYDKLKGWEHEVENLLAYRPNKG
jgi:adenylate kinase